MVLSLGMKMVARRMQEMGCKMDVPASTERRRHFSTTMYAYKSSFLFFFL